VRALDSRPPILSRARTHRVVSLWVASTLLLAVSLTGCTGRLGNTADPIQSLVDPDLGRKYLLYRPAAYDRRNDWPLVILCHSTFPDSPRDRISAWQGLADTRGFLLAAPQLEATKGRIGAGDALKLKEDERHILSVLQHVRAGHSVSEDRIFLQGWSGGAVPALFTGLGHSDVFRAVAVMQPRFSAAAMSDVQTRIDSFQPVFLDFNVIDRLTGSDGKECAEWLQQSNAALSLNPHGKSKGDDLLPTVMFFEDTIRKTAWIHVRSSTPDAARPREIKFKLQSSIQPVAYRWEFGDGQESPIAEPLHVYGVSGSYRVVVTVTGPRGASHKRAANVTVP